MSTLRKLLNALFGQKSNDEAKVYSDDQGNIVVTGDNVVVIGGLPKTSRRSVVISGSNNTVVAGSFNRVTRDD